MSAVARVLQFSAAWMLIGLVTGWLAVRVPRRWLATDTRLTRIRRFEERGRCYERRLRIERWKHRLPEAGALFAGGTSKRSTGGRRSEALQTFAEETRRAEWVHWAQIAAAPTFGLWNEWVVTVAMVAFATLVHLPFIVVQRYNRARVLPILLRRGATPARGDDAPIPAGELATTP